jgi:hypothetical protein
MARLFVRVTWQVARVPALSNVKRASHGLMEAQNSAYFSAPAGKSPRCPGEILSLFVLFLLLDKKHGNNQFATALSNVLRNLAKQ